MSTQATKEKNIPYYILYVNIWEDPKNYNGDSKVRFATEQRKRKGE